MTAKDIQESNSQSVMLDFDSLADQMRSRLRELEQRANSRTRDLQIAAEVSKQTATILNLNELLPQVVELTKARFNLYHVHIYLLDEWGENLVLAAGAGFPGRMMVENGHAITMNHPYSVVASAARERKTLVVNDVTATPNFLPNPLLPDTRSELATPLIIGDHLLGVLDVQSDQADYFTEDDIFIKSQLADQIAVAVQNALAFEQTQRSLQSLEISYQIAEFMRSDSSLEDTLETTLTYIADALRADTALFGYYELEEDIFRAYVGVNTGSDREELRSYIQSGDHLPHAKEAAKTGQVVAINDVRLYASFLQEYIELMSLKSVLTIPVFSGAKAIGVVFLSYVSTYHTFTKEEIELARAISSQLSIGIERKQSTAALADSEAQARAIAEDRARLFDNSIDLIGSAGFDGYFKELNPAWEATLGWTREELMSKPYIEFVHPDDVEPTNYEANDQLAKGYKTLSFVNRYQTKDGGWRWLSWNSTPDIEGGAIYFVTRDVTKQYEAEQELRDALKQVQDLQFAIDQSAIVAITEITGKILYVNERFAEISQYTVDELLGQDHRLVNSGYHSKEFVRDLWVTIANGQVWKGELRNRTKDGSVYWVDTTIVPVLNEKGKPERYISISYEITERKQQEELIVKRANELETAARVTTAAATILNVTELLQTVADLTKASFSLYHAHIYLFDEEKQALRLAAGAGATGAKMVGRGHQIPLNREHSLVAKAARSRTGVVSNDVRNEPDFLPNPDLPYTRSEMAIPMIVGSKLVGVLDVQSENVSHFKEEDLRTQTQLATQVAVAVENARQFQYTQEAQREAEILYTIAEKLTAATTPQEILEALEGYARENNADAVSLLYIDNDANGTPDYVETVAALGINDVPGAPVGTGFKLAEFSFAQSWILNPNAPVFIEDVMTSDQVDEYTRSAYVSTKTIASVLLPLNLRGRWLGLVNISWSKPHRFTEMDRRIYAAVSGQVAAVVDAARQFEATQAARHEAEILYNISEKLTRAISPDEIVGSFADYVADKGATSVTLFYTEVESGYSEAVANLALVSGFGTPVGTRTPMLQNPLTKLVELNLHEPILIEDITLHPNLDENTRNIFANRKIVGTALLPLNVQGRWIGSILINWDEPHRFTDQDQRIYTAISGQVASVVDAARLSEATLEAQRETATLYTISEKLTQAVTRHEILAAFEDYLRANGAASANLSYIDNDSAGKPEYVEAVANLEISAPVLWTEGMRFKISDYEFAQLWVQNPDAPLLVGDISNAVEIDETTRATYAANNVQATALLPLTLRSSWVGLVSITWSEPHAFTEEERRIFNTISGQVASVVDAARQFEATQAVQRETESLYNISEKLTQAVTRDDILKAFEDFIWEHGAVSASLTYIDNDANGVPDYIETVANLTLTSDARISPVGSRFKLSDFEFAQLWIKNPDEPIFVEDTNDPAHVDEATRTMYATLNTRATVVLPLNLRGRWVGLATVSWENPHRFSDVERRIYSAISGQTAAVVDAARLLEQTQERVREIEIVAEVGANIATNLDVDELLWSVANTVKDGFNRYYAHIYLLDDTAEYLTLKAGAGEVGRQLVELGHSIRIDAETSIVARAARTHQVVVINDVKQSPSFMANPLLPDTQAEMAVPIMVGPDILGVLDVQDSHSGAFTAVQVQAMTILANQIAVALQNARAFDEIQHATEALAMSEARATELAEDRNRLYENSIDLLGSASFDGWFKDLNPAWETTLGWSREELMSKPFVEFVHPDDADRTNAEVADQLAQGFKTISFQNRYKTKSGDWRWLSWNSYPDLDAGTIYFIARDVTREFEFEEQRKAAEQEREQNNRFLRAILDATPDWIFVKDLDYRMTMVNQSFADGLGKPIDEIIGKDDIEQGYPEELVFGNPEKGIIGFRNDDMRVIEKGETVTNPYDVVEIASGQRRIFDTKKFPLRDQQGNIYGMLGFAHDITEILEAQRAVQESREHAERVSKVNASLSRATDDHSILSALTQLELLNDISIATLIHSTNGEDGTPQELEMVALQGANGTELSLDILPSTKINIAELPLMDKLVENPREALFLEDMLTDKRVDANGRAYTESVNIRAAILIPLYSQNRWQGILSLNWAEPKTFSKEVRQVIAETRGSLSATLATRRTLLAEEAARRENERRAAELETVARVSAATTTILSVEELLDSVTDLTQQSFDLYHAQVYLIDTSGEHLLLVAGSGQAGMVMKSVGHNIPTSKEHSLVATAARTRLGVTSNNVVDDPFHLPNPLLANTRSEMAIPMVVGEKLIGVLDVQSDEADRFNDNDLRIMTTLADQIAIAVENANTFAETQRQAERERQTAEQLREVDRLKSQFLANMSHELRTPLNSIIGYSEVLLDGVDGELGDEAIEDVSAIHSSGKHLLAIINEILDLAKIEARQMKLDLERVELSNLVNEIVRSGQVLTKDKPVTVELVEESGAPVVRADKIRLRQIIWNLFSNAVKFTEKGTVRVYYGRVDEDMAYIKVMDSGVGIPEDKLGSIFERFSQVDGSSTRRAGGTGLGLTITQQLVHMHGGEIEVESELGVGSTFSFTIPLFKETAKLPEVEVTM